jgi:hypothetical protein
VSEFTFTGICRWAKVYTPDEKYGPTYSIEVKLEGPELDKYKAAGCQGNASKDGEGYYTFRRRKTILTRKGKVLEFGPPAVSDSDGNSFSAAIGNGSTVTVKVETYPTEKGVGTKLVAVRVDKHVVYESGSSVSSGDSAGVSAGPASGVTVGKIKNPF